jgi:ATP-binding cassette, subfamily C, bacterial CydD
MTANSRHQPIYNKKETARFLKDQKAASGRFLSLAVGSGFLTGSMLIAQAWILSDTVNKAVFKNIPLEKLWPGLCAMLGIFIVRAGLTWLSEIFAFKAAANVKKHLRRLLYDRFDVMGPKGLAQEEAGSLINTWLEGVDSMHDYYARYFPAMSLTVMVPLAILVFIYPVDLLSAIIMTVTAPAIPFFMILIGLGTEKLNQKQWRKLSYLSGYFLNIIQGMTTLKLFNASKREAEMVRKISEDYRVETMKVLRVAFLSSLTLEFFATLSIALIAVTIGFRLMWADLDFKRGFFILLLAPEFYLPLRRMGVFYHARLQAIGASETMIRVLKSDPVSVPQQNTLKSNLSVPHIIFKNVTFGYTDKKIIDDVSFEILPGMATGLVGETGSGKTTLMALLLGFLQPQQGTILINGTDLKEIDLEDYHRQLGWVPQSPTLLQGSVRDNILLGNPHAPDQELYPLCNALRISEFVQGLPQGYDTLLGEKGLGLSGGQVQRIALARAFIRKTNFLLMDEPTASLDHLTESIIDQALMEIGAAKTRFVIAHRQATIQAMDVLYRIENGKVMKVKK